MTEDAGIHAEKGPPMSRRVTPALAAVAALAAAALLYFVSPEREGIYPPCPFHYLTGLYCPGCGSMRAVARLLHGDVAGALGRNPLLVMLLPLVLYECASQMKRAVSGRGLPKIFGGRAIWALAAAVILFFILRNVPIYPLTLLAP